MLHSMRLSPGTRLGNYEILSPLGAGGMGEVYRARDTHLRRDVAIKVLPEAVASSPERLARFEREARTIAGLNHPNIVTLFSSEDQDGIRFLAMELVEGQTLGALVAPGGLPLSHVLELSIPLADALVAAHERGVVHRDLKPGNIMVTRERRVKVLDFGLAKVTGSGHPDQGETATTRSVTSAEGQVMGTVPYMAPEQIRGEAVDARTDLFAFGIIFYELLTGRRPFRGATSGMISAAILNDTPEPVQAVRADLSGDVDWIVSRCLEKERRARFQTALDISNELRRLKRTPEGPAPAKTAALEAASIVVLPFLNRSRDKEDEYFSDGLADELLNMLAKIRGLRVAARTSSFHFKGKGSSLAEVGKALNVATVLEGSVRRSGDRVRISVQLVKVSDGYHLWSETYDRTLEDIFAVQDDIARSVVKELRMALLGEEADSRTSGEVRVEVARAARGRAQNAEAHRLYLQARHLIDRLTREDTTRGIGYLNEALKLDPGYALAWAELGWAYSRESDFNWAPVAEGYGRARVAIERALSLEPDLAEGHSRLGWIQLIHDWNWAGAEASFRRALDLAPGNASALRGAAALARAMGRLEDTIALCRRAIAQDPLSSVGYHNLGYMLQAAGSLLEAEDAYRQALELVPQRASTRASLALLRCAQGRADEALVEAMLEPDRWLRLWALAILHRSAGRGARSDEALRELVAEGADGSAFQIAEVYGSSRETDAAFQWLERAYTQRDPGMTEMQTSERLRSLHADPRWAALLSRMGLKT